VSGFSFYPAGILHPGFLIQKYGVPSRAASAVSLVCKANVRQPSAICAKLGIPSVSLHPHLPYVPQVLREEGIKNFPKTRSQRLQTKGK